jgi:hypothetical protein
MGRKSRIRKALALGLSLTKPALLCLCTQTVDAFSVCLAHVVPSDAH